ncbi:50S ribosomal protein L22 [Helicobacter sp. 12S02634-8]|uniref:50S ribosomal protein L22 n=1 Tax=Helicobacter sp. 12S02634-8 TaxID=1476199 RepID=UPI000BA7A8A5|nr:50S ribosomal protein L22 [Helicobacter sp. 12S02634-8]PAF47295.1 50S ribosomal protein L22 [Helicobacter sp. 12S02634-8]
MSKALLRYIRLSPTKARLVAREIQGMNAELAIASLEFTPNKAARIISKVIASAIANGGFDAQNSYITSCRVDAGPVLRRFMPRAKGRATPIRKPTSHILVEVSDQVQAKNPKKGSAKNTQATPKKDSPKAKDSQRASKRTSQMSKKTEGEDK